MLKDAIETAYLHYQRALDNFNDIEESWLNPQLLEDKEKIKTIDAFMFRFIKLQDFMGDKLFKFLLNSLGEYKDNMSLIDVLDKMERLDLINDGEQWLIFRKFMNKLTHEYPNNKQETINGIGLALKHFKQIETILQKISSYINEKGLLIYALIGRHPLLT